MACILEIKKTIEESIDKQLPNREAVMSKEAAKGIVDYLNTLWNSAVTRIAQYSSQGGYKVVVNSIEDAAQKEYKKQLTFEKEIDEIQEEINAEQEEQNLFDAAQQVNEDIERAGGEDNIFFQTPNLESSVASPELIKIVRDLLKRIGVSEQSVKDIIVDGIKQDANGVALIMQKIAQVVEGKEAKSLPEEAMHFVVEIVKQTNPVLYNKLLKEINNYKILDFVRQEYNSIYVTKEGKPDVVKIKDEAIAKLLVETIIKEREGITEKPELLEKVKKEWWKNILDLLKNLFIKSGFDQLSIDILTGKNIGTAQDISKTAPKFYLQATDAQQKIVNNLKSVSDSIDKRDDGYYINGEKIKNRVSDLVSEWYDRTFRDKDINENEFNKAINDLKAEKGTELHAVMEYAFDRFVNVDGTLRDVILDDADYQQKNPNIPYELYDILRENLEKRLNSYPEGTIFLKEQTIYDAKRNLAGTVDFLAITPEGKVSILDWKFMDLDIDKYTDIPWYKVKAWNLQMQNYKSIIANNYNVNNEDFQQTMMVPIKALYSKANFKENILPTLLSVKIGDVNVKNITEDYLIPVPLKDQKTGNNEIDELIEKLNAIYDKISKRKVDIEDKQNKAEQLNALFTAIRQLQMRENIAPLIAQAEILNKDIEFLIEEYNTKFKNKDAKSFSQEEINDFANNIESSIEAIEIYQNLDLDLEFLFNKTLSEEEKELEKQLQEAVKNSRKYKDRLKKIDRAFTDDIIGKSESVEKLSKPEKIVRGITKFLGNTATIQLKALQVLYKKAGRAFDYASKDLNDEIKTLQNLKKEYQVWASGKGLTEKNYFDILKKKDENKLIDEYDREFYSKLKQAINKDTRDLQWIRENIDIPAYKTYLKEKLKTELERIVYKERLASVEELENLHDQSLLPVDVELAVSRAKSLYDITDVKSSGWLLYEDIKKFPKPEWYSKEYKELTSKGNEAAFNFYNYIKQRNEYFQSIGYIHAKQARTFLPWVRKGLAEKLIFGGKMTLGEQFLRNISVDEADTGYGQVDPLTGKPINTVPIYLTTDFGEDYSTDLFKTMAMYNEFAIRFKYLTDIEYQIRALVRLENNKKAIATSYFGKTEFKNGEIQYTPDNSENAKLVEDMMKAIIYQQKYIESESFDQLLGTIGKFGSKINKKLGFTLVPENLEGRQLSLNKSITALNNNFQLATLGLNVLSSFSNLFGGKTQAFINSGKYGTRLDFISTEKWLIENRMGGSDKQKMIAALDFFLPLTENVNREIMKGLSINKITENNVQDILMSLMRYSDKAVQTTGFFFLLKNTIVLNNKLVNVREYLRTTPEFSEMYKGSESEREEKANKFEQKVKELLDEKSVLKLSKVVDGKLVIPGVDRKDESIVEFTRKVKQFASDALGSMTEENKRLINLTIMGNSFMLFKNWLPRLVDVRLGNLKYNSASDAYEWGRSRMVFRTITEDFLKSINLLKGSVLGLNDSNIEFIQNLYEKKSEEYFKDTGKKLNMTEDQFIDLVKSNIRNQLLDTLFYAALFALYAGLKAIPPDDDEDPRVKNQWKFILKATDKIKDELGYFYNPANLTQLFSNGIFPSVGMLDNYKKVVINFANEMYGLSFEDDKYVEKNYVIKYLMKSFPITNQMSGILPMFFPNLAKDLGIKMPSQYGIR